MTTDRDDSVAANVTLNNATISGGAGNDKIRAPSSMMNTKVYGDDGDDKITSAPLGFNAETELLVGGNGHDIIYGGADRLYGKYYGDFQPSSDGFDPLLGGNDVIYGGPTDNRLYVGGGYDDRLYIGSDGMGPI